ncbi:hypothetical protein KIL84_004721 [Mauremys mutica]|uniref:Uncharacterized protein n=1 Tax=Mauremys mutica TaxID=74926 RepID=A0A9D3XMA1_9SAUR|nr:hypothetical protein KIL84_004721 [Mauremys mutica]
MDFRVRCREEISLLDLLLKKKELEKKGLMTEGLGACFCQTLELVASSQKTHQDDWILKNARLIIQADGSCWEFLSGNADQLLLVWDRKSQAKQTEQQTPFLRSFVRKFPGGKGAGGAAPTTPTHAARGSSPRGERHSGRGVHQGPERAGAAATEEQSREAGAHDGGAGRLLQPGRGSGTEAVSGALDQHPARPAE